MIHQPSPKNNSGSGLKVQRNLPEEAVNLAEKHGVDNEYVNNIQAKLNML